MKKLTNNNYDELKVYYREFNNEISDISLLNLLLWDEKYDFHYDIIDGCLFIINKSSHGLYFSEPIGKYTEEKLISAVLKLKSHYAENSTLVIKKASVEFARLLESKGIAKNISSSRDHDDYVYSREDMMYLKGNKYHKKKNHVNQFIKRYDYDFTLRNESYNLEIDQFLSAWYREKEDEDLAIEHRGIQRLLSLEDEDIEVGLLRVERKIIGLSIIEYLPNDMVVMHVEKGNYDYKGVYPMLFKETMTHAKRGRWINREQDLGNAGLRKAKQSYHPDRMIAKYRIDL